MNADRLKEAARVLRERAEAATPKGHTHPWLYTDATYGDPADGPTHVAVTCCGANGVEVRHFLHADDGSHETSETARYIATMHPGVGLALADWLDVEADEQEVLGGSTEAGAMAHRVADLILGGAS